MPYALFQYLFPEHLMWSLHNNDSLTFWISKSFLSSLIEKAFQLQCEKKLENIVD